MSRSRGMRDWPGRETPPPNANTHRSTRKRQDPWRTDNPVRQLVNPLRCQPRGSFTGRRTGLSVLHSPAGHASATPNPGNHAGQLARMRRRDLPACASAPRRLSSPPTRPGRAACRADTAGRARAAPRAGSPSTAPPPNRHGDRVAVAENRSPPASAVGKTRPKRFFKPASAGDRQEQVRALLSPAEAGLKGKGAAFPTAKAGGLRFLRPGALRPLHSPAGHASATANPGTVPASSPECAGATPSSSRVDRAQIPNNKRIEAAKL